MNLLKSNFQLWNNLISASNGCAKVPPHLLLPFRMFDLQCGIKTQLLMKLMKSWIMKKSIPFSDLQYRISGNLEKILSLQRCRGDSGGSTTETTSELLRPVALTIHKRWSRRAKRGEYGCYDVRMCLVCHRYWWLKDFFPLQQFIWKQEPRTQLPGVQSLNIPGWFSSHLWQFVMDLCQISLALYTRFCRLLRKSLSI